MSKLVVALILALCVLHHDLWWWDSATPVVFGFMPIGLAWHTGISVAAAFAWWLAVKYCWPSHLEEGDS